MSLALVLVLAAAPAGEVTVEQALELLEQQSPFVAAERARIAVAEAERVGAAVWPNPAVSWQGQELVQGESTGAVGQHQFSVAAPLLMFGQRGLRGEAAEAVVVAERARVAASIADRRLSVREAWARLRAGQERVAAVAESLQDLERAVKVVSARAAAGDRSRYDVERIELEQRMREAERIDLLAEVDGASGDLASLLGLPQWRPRAAGAFVPAGISDDPLELWRLAEVRRPALAAARARQEQARASLASARRDGWPVPAVTAGAAVTRQVNGVSLLIGLSLPLPLTDRNQGAVARAAAEVDAQGLQVAAELADGRAEIERAAAVLVRRKAALATLEKEVVKRLPALRVMAEDAYREGRAGILELLDAQRSIKEARMMYLEQIEEVLLAEAQVISASGLDVN